MYSLAKLQSYRCVLVILATVGLLGLNGTFIYYALLQPQALADAFRHPVSLVFILEAFIMVGFTAFVIRLVGLERPAWLAFVALSLVGGLAFSVPLFLLLQLRKPECEHNARHPV